MALFVSTRIRRRLPLFVLITLPVDVSTDTFAAAPFKVPPMVVFPVTLSPAPMVAAPVTFSDVASARAIDTSEDDPSILKISVPPLSCSSRSLAVRSVMSLVVDRSCRLPSLTCPGVTCSVPTRRATEIDGAYVDPRGIHIGSNHADGRIHRTDINLIRRQLVRDCRRRGTQYARIEDASGNGRRVEGAIHRNNGGIHLIRRHAGSSGDLLCRDIAQACDIPNGCDRSRRSNRRGIEDFDGSGDVNDQVGDINRVERAAPRHCQICDTRILNVRRRHVNAGKRYICRRLDAQRTRVDVAVHVDGRGGRTVRKVAAHEVHDGTIDHELLLLEQWIEEAGPVVEVDVVTVDAHEDPLQLGDRYGIDALRTCDPIVVKVGILPGDQAQGQGQDLRHVGEGPGQDLLGQGRGCRAHVSEGFERDAILGAKDGQAACDDTIRWD
eukprot:scaffold2601_cov198-Pinguiococcus_pyrenoidosus.AAC.6